MKEIGGYLELDEYQGKEYYSELLALNCGRNALAYVVESRGYKKVFVPDYCCDSVYAGIAKGGASIDVYPVGADFRPIFAGRVEKREAVLIVNFYGQLFEEELLSYQQRWGRIIVDNTQSFFQKPLWGMDTIYSCRKFFGVPDGAYVATDLNDCKHFERDISARRVLFVLGRYDENAEKYYEMASHNNEVFSGEPIKYMSRLTRNMLRGLDYEWIAERRERNAAFLHDQLGDLNEIECHIPRGAFMYPFYSSTYSGAAFRAYLHRQKIFVPCLWPDVLQREATSSLAYRMANNIMPLPCDQRYNEEDMQLIVDKVNDFLRGEQDDC